MSVGSLDANGVYEPSWPPGCDVLSGLLVGGTLALSTTHNLIASLPQPKNGGSTWTHCHLVSV